MAWWKMGFTERQYVLHVLLGSPEALDLWHWERWLQVVAALDPLVQSARGPAVVYSAQFEGATGKTAVSFGRLTWNSKAHQKWTHGSPLTFDRCKEWKFLSTEVWAPSPQACDREKKPADFFFWMRNEAFWNARNITFSPTILLAIAEDKGTQLLKLHQQVAARISDLISARLHVSKRRPWARPFGKVAMTNALQDLVVTGLFKVGPYQEKGPCLEIFEEEWSLVNQACAESRSQLNRP